MEPNREQTVEGATPSKQSKPDLADGYEISTPQIKYSARNRRSVSDSADREKSVEGALPSQQDVPDVAWTPLMKYKKERNQSPMDVTIPVISVSSPLGSQAYVTPMPKQNVTKHKQLVLGSKAYVTPANIKLSPSYTIPGPNPKFIRGVKDELETRRAEGVYSYRPNIYFEKLIPNYYQGVSYERGFPDMDYPSRGTRGALRFEKDFLKISTIGKGTFATVDEVLNRVEGCRYAMKIVHCAPREEDRQRNRESLIEVQALAYLGIHDNIVRYYNSFYENEYLYIQLQLCDFNLKSVNLADERFTSQKALLNMIYQISVALEFIHRRGIIHIAVSPRKIYIADSHFKLGGFRYAARKDKMCDIKTMGLDTRYAAPEIFDENIGPKQLDPKLLDRIDVFSLGATVYELVRGFSAQHAYSHSFEQLVTAMMHESPSSRPSTKALLETLRDEFGISSATPISLVVPEDD